LYQTGTWYDERVRLTKRFEQALKYASVLHARQLRKGTQVPYVAHLLATAAIALEHGASEDEAIAALLHDAVEDQGGKRTLAAIRRKFGPVVADIVEGCTDTDQQPKPPWRPRKQAYLAHLRRAPASVRLVSAADKLHNARSTVSDLREHGARVWDRFSAGPDEQLWYYESLVATFRRLGPRALATELALVVAEMRALARTRRPTRRSSPTTRRRATPASR
jgi:(p)ppGpp synthase/HD superfamily hydrolase